MDLSQFTIHCWANGEMSMECEVCRHDKPLNLDSKLSDIVALAQAHQHDT